MDDQSFGVVGAGATGGFVAASLARADYEVTLLTRGDNVGRIREHGIRVEGPGDEAFTARPTHVVDAKSDFEPVDITLFCVKSYDTEAAADQIEPLVGENGTILCLQNGVANEDILAERYGASRVLAGVLYIGCERVDTGQIRCSTPARVIFGPYEDVEAPPPLLGWLKSALTKAGIDASIDPAIRQAKWQKFLFNCGLNPLTALTGIRLGAIRATDEGSSLFDDLVDEAMTVARASGAPLADDAREQVSETADRMDISSSMAEDLAAGRGLELDAFGGHVIRLGEAQSLEVPVTRTITRLLNVVDPGRTPREVG